MANTIQIKRRTDATNTNELGTLSVGELGVDLTDSNKLYVGSSSGNQLLNPTASTNADTVDSLHAASFLRSDASDTYNCNGNVLSFDFDGDRNSIQFSKNGYNRFVFQHTNSGNDLDIQRGGSNSGGKLKYAGNEVFTVAGGTLTGQLAIAENSSSGKVSAKFSNTNTGTWSYQEIQGWSGAGYWRLGVASEGYSTVAWRKATWLYSHGGPLVLGANNSDRAWLTNTSFYPSTSGHDLGTNAQRWQLYATSGDFSGSITAAGGTLTGSLTTNGDIIINKGNGTLRLNDTTNGSDFVIFSNSSELRMAQHNATFPGAYLNLTTGGNLGLGVTGASERLEVSGKAIFTDAVSVGQSSAPSGNNKFEVYNTSGNYNAVFKNSGQATIEVKGGENSSARIRLIPDEGDDANNADHFQLIHETSNNFELQRYVLNSGWEWKWKLDSSNNVHQTGNLTVGGRLTVSDTSGADGLVIAGGENTGISARLFFENGTSGQGISILNVGGSFQFRTGATAGSSSGVNRLHMSTGGTLYPEANDTTLGLTTKRWKLRATSGNFSGQAEFQNKLHLIGLTLDSGQTPSYIKIKTKIPFASSAADFTVNIKGFQYGSARTVDLKICWHYYNSAFYNATISSAGGWLPTAQLSAEDDNGTEMVCIVLASPGYWPKMYVESAYSKYYGSSTNYFTGWTWTDAAATGTGNKLVTLT